MDTATYQTIKRLYLEVRELGRAERARVLEQRCAGQAALRAEVEALLAQEETLGDFLAQPARAAAEEAPAPASHPERIGAYRILKPLGFGGMGVVYLAEQDSPRRAVALKLLRFDSASPRQVERFEQEAELLGRLSHPGIARVYEAGWAETETGRRPYFAMEYVEGRALHEHVTEEKLDLAAKLRLLSQVAEAAHYAHERGVVHRDLKPSNVLVDERGEPKVLDFGVARPVGTSHATQTGHLVGTLAYMSPEQAAGNGSIDARADVYALGAILYELLTGRLPVPTEGLALHEAVRRVREEEPIPAGSVRPELRGDLATILGKALAKEPERRYASAAELAEDLRLTLENRPIRARPPTTAYVAWKLVRRHRTLAALAALLLLALLAMQYAALQFVQRGRELERSEAQKTFYVELGHKVAERATIRDLEGEAELLLARADMPVEILEGWRERAERLVERLDARRTELEAMRRYQGPRPVPEEECQQLLEVQGDIVNSLERMIGPRGHLPEIRARILRARGGGG
ncbi:MAG TPA: serine/threonine-protein kinase [Planctomycetota bacterium]